MTLFFDEATRAYFKANQVKLAIVLAPTFLALCMILFSGETKEAGAVSPERTLTLLSLLFLGYWHFDKWPSVANQSLSFRLALGLYEGFFASALIALLMPILDPEFAVLRFVLFAIFFGGIRALTHKSFVPEVTPDAKAVRSSIIAMCIAIGMFVMGLSEGSQKVATQIGPIAVFASLVYPAPFGWKTLDSKVRMILYWLVLGLFFLVVFL